MMRFVALFALFAASCDDSGVETDIGDTLMGATNIPSPLRTFDDTLPRLDFALDGTSSPVASVLSVSGVPTQSAPNGSLALSDNGILYARTGGAWAAISTGSGGGSALVHSVGDINNNTFDVVEAVFPASGYVIADLAVGDVVRYAMSTKLVVDAGFKGASARVRLGGLGGEVISPTASTSIGATNTGAATGCFRVDSIAVGGTIAISSELVGNANGFIDTLTLNTTGSLEIVPTYQFSVEDLTYEYVLSSFVVWVDRAPAL